MQKVRISATNLEAFRRWLLNEEATVADFIRYLKKEDEPSEFMKQGSAFHSFLEEVSKKGEFEQVEKDGYLFDFSELESENALYLPEIREFKFTKLIDFNQNLKIEFVGVVDAIDGDAVYDHKLTNKIDLSSYEDSMQWRVYLWWLNKNTFVYNLFEKGYTRADEPFNLVKVKDFVNVKFNAYKGMDLEIMELVGKFIDFIFIHCSEMVQEI